MLHSISHRSCSRRSWRIGFALGFVGIFNGIAPAEDRANLAPVDFISDIQPILSRHCSRCHSGSNREAGLALDSGEAILGIADSGETVVTPGAVNESLLWLRISDPDSGDLMPLDGNPLSKQERTLIGRWIELGANMPAQFAPKTHWAYAPPIKHAPPVDETGWARNVIDQFVLSRMDAAGLSPSDPADPETLARRVSLVLTGLPATREQIAALRDDPSEISYEHLVDELLASPRFGEHWTRHWLDLARYADSNGFQADQLRDSWAYRDWVIQALNADKPFDEFVIEQLAGDVMPGATVETRIATGFHRTPTCNVEAGVHPEANRVNQVFDRVDTTATVFLGTTLECAQCHDHKYDPFTQVDYYRLFAYFNNTPLEVEKTAGVTFDFVGPKMDLPLDPTSDAKRQRLLAKKAQLNAELEKHRDGDGFENWLEATRKALADGRAEWVTPRPTFSTNVDEPFEVLDDNSILLASEPPASAVYRFEYREIAEPIIGLRLETLRHDRLPGSGPGRGDPVRTNFVLHEVSAAVESSTAEGNTESREFALVEGAASFSQAKYDVSNAVDRNSKTGWAIAPKFGDEHWAEFRTEAPIELTAGQLLTVSLDQHFGQSRLIGRPRISLLVGPPATANLTEEIVQLLSSSKKLNAKQLTLLRSFYAEHDEKVRKLTRQLASIDTQLENVTPPTTLVMQELDEARETFVMQRGDYLSPGEQVQPGTPAILNPLSRDLPTDRYGLARWLVDPANPLLARVTVNRFWGEIFGRGLVTTPEDFGTQSDPPSHPHLLDWLAVDFQELDWSVKALLKQIVMSSTFRQSSRMSAELLANDPSNRLLARGPRFRMTAEAIRDNALAVSGLLAEGGSGTPIMPYQPDGIWRAVGRNQPKWKAESDEARFRRGVYVLWKRGAPYPSFTTFDAPDRASCTVSRPRTNTPLQALVLLNDLAYGEAAVGLAQRMIREAEDSSDRSIATTGYALATGRTPTSLVIDRLVALAESELTTLEQNPTLVTERVGLLPNAFRDTGLDSFEVARWFAVANALLNLDVTITVD